MAGEGSLNDAIDMVLEHVERRRSEVYDLAKPYFFQAMNCEQGGCARVNDMLDPEQQQKLRREEQAAWASRHRGMQQLQSLVTGLNDIKAGKL